MNTAFVNICNSVGKESVCNAGDRDLIPGSGRAPGEGKGNPLQYSCLENPRDRRTYLATKPPPPYAKGWASPGVDE